MTTNYKLNYRVLKVFGQLWSGDQCSYEYTIAGPVTSIKEAKQIAVDFASLNSAIVEIVEKEIREKITTIELQCSYEYTIN